jgi:hypothetical protein
VKGLRVVILCPDWGGPNDFWTHLGLIKGFGTLLELGKVRFQKGMYIQQARREAVEAALEMDDWHRLVWMDYDHLFPADFLEQQMELHYPQQAIVAGLYHARRAPFPPIAYRWILEDGSRATDGFHPEREKQKQALQHIGGDETMLWYDHPGLYEVDVAGMGAMSVARGVYEKWRLQWPEVPWYATPTTPQGEVLGEDVWFCNHARQLGFPIWVHSGLPVRPLIPYAVSGAAYQKQREVVQGAS